MELETEIFSMGRLGDQKNIYRHLPFLVSLRGKGCLPFSVGYTCSEILLGLSRRAQ
jgi:hypothetical protein